MERKSTNDLSQNAISVVSKTLPTQKQTQLLYDLATQLAIDPLDTKLHDIIKLELDTEHLWYKVQDDGMFKMGLFVFSDTPIPTKLNYALNKLGTTSKNKHNILNTVAYALMQMNNKAGGDITNTHDFVKSILVRMRHFTTPEDRHIGGFFGDLDFTNLENILKTVGSYKK